MKIKPLFDRVLVTPVKQENTTKSGIVLSQLDDDEHISFGKVVAIGDDNRNFSVRVGETILFEEYATAKLIVENQEYFLIKEIDILGVLGED
jgi:chaperonin GroES